jgi:hypothetical protein
MGNKTWMPGTRPGMTKEGLAVGSKVAGVN